MTSVLGNFGSMQPFVGRRLKVASSQKTRGLEKRVIRNNKYRCEGTSFSLLRLTTDQSFIQSIKYLVYLKLFSMHPVPSTPPKELLPHRLHKISAVPDFIDTCQCRNRRLKSYVLKRWNFLVPSPFETDVCFLLVLSRLNSDFTLITRVKNLWFSWKKRKS